MEGSGSLCMLSNAGRMICNRQSIFDESKASSGFFKTILAIWGQISRLQVSKL